MSFNNELDNNINQENLVKPPVAEKVGKSEDDMIAMYEQSFSNIEPNQIVEGTIVSVNDKEVMVDIGYKSEGSIPIHEFSSLTMPKKGDKLSVWINAVEDDEGKLKLSKKRADFVINIEKMKVIFQNNETVQGVLRRRVKGGMIVDVLGLEAFLPGSQISLKPIPNLDQFIGKESQFKIIKLDEERRNIIVSRKKVLEEENESKKVRLKEKIQIGAELDGEVKNITDYGAFIDLGGMDGLLHITDMSWGHINHPSELLNIGTKIKVKVIGYDDANQRVSLGLKQLVPHPWENIEAKYLEGTKVSGKVVNLVNYGAFIELEPGVEGLIHVSEMSWTKKINHPKQLVKIGDSVNAIVLSVSKEDQRISLGMKQMEPNPWLTIDDRYPLGSTITRKIKSLTQFGIFVEVEPEIDGLVHISDISWTKRVYHPKEMFRKGQEITAVVLSVDTAMKKIALGIKQMHNDPWENLAEILPVNSEINGIISKIIPKGVLVDVEVNGGFVEGFVPITHLAITKLEKPEWAFDMNEEIPLKVIELDMENRRLILSVKAFFFAREKEVFSDFLKLHEQRIKERAPHGVSKMEESNYDAHDEEYPTHDEVYAAHAEVMETPEEVCEAPVEAIEPTEEVEVQEEKTEE